MASNFKSPGKVLTVQVPAAGVTTGLAVLIGTIFGVALRTVAYAASTNCDIAVTGVWYLLKATGAWLLGDKIYWDATNAVCTNVPAAGLRFIGYAQTAAGSSDASGYVRLNGTASLVGAEAGPAAASIATAGAGTYTAAHILNGIIVRDCTGASRTDTLPTAAALVAALPGAKVGDIVKCLIVNGSDPVTEIITLQEGSGGGWDANQTAVSRTILGTCSKLVHIRLTNVTASSEAYVVYA